MLKFKPVLTPYLFLFPALLMLTLTVFWPALQAFYLSLFSYDLLTPPCLEMVICRKWFFESTFECYFYSAYSLVNQSEYYLI